MGVSREFDVIVVGCGGAGLAAALAAQEKGARVCILERASKDDVPVIEGVATTLKTAELLVEVKQQLGTWRCARGYYQAIPPRERVKELTQLYGISKLFSTAEQST